MTNDPSTTRGAPPARDATPPADASGGYARALRAAFDGAQAASLTPDAAPPAIAAAMARLGLASER